MRGSNLKNIYIIEGVEYYYTELTSAQKENSEQFLDRKVSNDFRNELLESEGDDLEGVIKIELPKLIMTAFDEYGVKL